jgi:serine/threonine protein kinase
MELLVIQPTVISFTNQHQQLKWPPEGEEYTSQRIVYPITAINNSASIAAPGTRDISVKEKKEDTQLFNEKTGGYAFHRDGVVLSQPKQLTFSLSPKSLVAPTYQDRNNLKINSLTGQVQFSDAFSPSVGDYSVIVLAKVKSSYSTEKVKVGMLSFTVTNTTTYRRENGEKGSKTPTEATRMPIVLIIGIVITFLTLVVLVLALFMWRRRMPAAASFTFPEKDMWEFDREMLATGAEIGQGAFGVVYTGKAINIRDKPGETVVAIKHCAPDGTAVDKIDFVHEAEQMKLFKHKNVLSLLGVCMQDEPLCIIVEMMELGDMKEYLRAKHETPMPELLNLAFDVSAGLAYLARIHVVYVPAYCYVTSLLLLLLSLACLGSMPCTCCVSFALFSLSLSLSLSLSFALSYRSHRSFPVVPHCRHRDLAARNCLLAADRTAKIADFGMTRELVFRDYYRVNKHNLLPVRWMSIEALTTGRFTPASDVWSLGVVFWEISCHCEMPYVLCCFLCVCVCLCLCLSLSLSLGLSLWVSLSLGLSLWVSLSLSGSLSLSLWVCLCLLLPPRHRMVTNTNMAYAFEP